MALVFVSEATRNPQQLSKGFHNHLFLLLTNSKNTETAKKLGVEDRGAIKLSQTSRIWKKENETKFHSAQVNRQSCPWLLKLMTSQAVEGRWIRTGGYVWFSGQWVKKHQGPVPERPISANLGLTFCSIFFVFIPSYTMLRVKILCYQYCISE